MSTTKKMHFEDYWEKIVGETAKRVNRIHKELENLTEWLLSIIEAECVIKERKEADAK